MNQFLNFLIIIVDFLLFFRSFIIAGGIIFFLFVVVSTRKLIFNSSTKHITTTKRVCIGRTVDKFISIECKIDLSFWFNSDDREKTKRSRNTSEDWISFI